MDKYQVGILGATGMVGQRFVSLCAEHPWFEIKILAASPRSAGKTYAEVMDGRWSIPSAMPDSVREIVIKDATGDAREIADSVDFVFCAVDMDKSETRALEEMYAKLECPVISNNSAHRWTPDVPMIIPEINHGHAAVIPHQKKRLGTSRGFIAVKSNCSIQSYVPALHPLWDRGVERVLACTYQAISGAGKTFESWPEMVDNVIPYIGGEEEKSEQEPLKVWGEIVGGEIVPAISPSITTQCIRVPVSDGHMAAVFMTLRDKLSPGEILARWDAFTSLPVELGLPSAPEKFLTYFTEDNRPQTKLERDLYGGMGVTLGRLRPDNQFDYKFICLSHNTVRGAAGGGVLMAEMLCKMGYIERR